MAERKKISSSTGNLPRCTVVNLFGLKKCNRLPVVNLLVPKNGAFSVLGGLPTVQRYYIYHVCTDLKNFENQRKKRWKVRLAENCMKRGVKIW